jgi:RNA polymerase sigma factor (sigma-70 family)
VNGERRGDVRRRAELCESEFRALYLQHLRPLQRHVERRIDVREFARDIVSETFWVAWEHALRGEVVDAPWLYVTANNKLRDHFKRRRRRDAAEIALRRLAEEPSPMLSALESIALHSALATLSPRDREVVTLTYWDGLSAEEIARILRMSKSAVWTALSRARDRLRAELTEPDEVGEGRGGAADER